MSRFHDLLSESYSPLQQNQPPQSLRTNYSFSNRPFRTTFHDYLPPLPPITSEYAIFSVDDILTSDECHSIIQTSEDIGFQNLDEIFPQNYRQSSRVMIFSQKLARILYNRIMPYFLPEDLCVVPIGFSRSGRWIPVRLNECLKVIKYNCQGMIVPHQDGPWVPFEDQASIYTIVFYLNDDFSGGQTVLFPSAEFGQSQLRHFPHIKPKRGKMAVFDHRVFHSSKSVKSSSKYILRAELIFQRVYSPSVLLHSINIPNYQYLYSPDYQEARRLYEVSRSAEQSGQKEEFVSKYNEVLGMQIFASMEANIKAKEHHYLEHEMVWKLVVLWLPLTDIAQLSLVSQGMNELLSSNEIWQGLYITRWGDSLLPHSKSGPVKKRMSSLIIDWRSLYQLRTHFIQSFSSTLIYIGVNTIYYGCPSIDANTWFRLYRPNADFKEMKFAFDGQHEIVIGRIPSVFCDFFQTPMLGNKMPFHINMPDYVRFVPFYNTKREVQPTPAPPIRQNNQEICSELNNAFPRKGRSLVFDTGEPVNWSVCAALIRLVIGLQSTKPLLLIVNPVDFPCVPITGYPNEKEIDSSSFLNLIQDTYEETILAFSVVLSTPAIRIEHVGVPALASLGLTSGVVIWVSCDVVYVSSIRLGIVRANECLKDRIGRDAAIGCLSVASVWKSEGHWDMNIQDMTTQEFSQITNSVPIVLIQPRDITSSSTTTTSQQHYHEVLAYLQSQQYPSDHQNDGKFIHIHRPNSFQFMGEVDCYGILKGGYKLSVNYDHRAKCIFNSCL